MYFRMTPSVIKFLEDQQSRELRRIWTTGSTTVYLFAISTFAIIHLVYLPKNCVTFVFHFPWALQSSREKMKTVPLQYFLGAGVEMANTILWIKVIQSTSKDGQNKMHDEQINDKYMYKAAFTQAIFVAATRCNFCRAQGCNFKIASVNQVRFLVRFVAAISQGFLTCLKLDAILARQKLHRVAATKIACVNGP